MTIRHGDFSHHFNNKCLSCKEALIFIPFCVLDLNGPAKIGVNGLIKASYKYTFS